MCSKLVRNGDLRNTGPHFIWLTGCCSSFRKVFAYDFDLVSGSVTNKRVAIDVTPELGVCSFKLI
jgi:hypothetical protein